VNVIHRSRRLWARKSAKTETSRVGHVIVSDSNCYHLTSLIDQNYAEQARARRSRCDGLLKRHATRASRSEFQTKPTSPASSASAALTVDVVPRHFLGALLGKRVYTAAIMNVVSARVRAPVRRPQTRHLNALGVSASKIERGRHCWMIGYVNTPF